MEFARKLSVLMAENLMDFDVASDLHLRRLILQLSGQASVPEASVLYYHISELYNDYQQYFQQFFKTHNSNYSLTLHRWNCHVFFHIQYLDDSFNLFEFPLGMFKAEDMEGALIRNTILQDLTGKINFVTTNFELEPKTKQIINFLFNNDDNSDSKILQCFPSFIMDAYYDFLLGVVPGNLKSIMDENVSFSAKIHRLFAEFIKEIPNISLLVPKVDIFVVRDLVTSKADMEEAKVSLLTAYEWQLLEFISYITAFNYKLLSGDNRNLNSPFLIQYTKYELYLVNKMMESFPTKYNLLSRGIYKKFEEFYIKIDTYHRQLSTKSDILIATYLSSSARKFLTTQEIQEVRSKVFRDDGTQSPEDSINVLDGVIMEVFQSSGNLNNECFLFESTPASKLTDFIEFWKSHGREFPTLSKLAKKILLIQICSDRNFDKFKEKLAPIQAQIQSQLTDGICSVEAFYFVHMLSQEVDLIGMQGDVEKCQHRRVGVGRVDLGVRDIP